jgi:hypothetical protein
VLRLTLDINVFVADILSRQNRVATTACAQLVNWAANGVSPAGPTQLVISHPMLENFANVLVRAFGYSALDAQARADLLNAYATEGPIPIPPFIAVAMGFVPFETEAEMRQSVANFGAKGTSVDKLFHETQDDRYVLETAIAGQADVLVTLNLEDFARGGVIRFERDDMFVVPFAGKDLVVSKPAFAAHWIARGVVPHAKFVRDNPDEFRVRP